MLGGIIRAIGANKEAKRLQKQADALNPVRPEYEIPQEIRDMIEASYNQAQGDMAGYGRMINQAQGTTANTLANARNFAGSGTDLLQNLALAGESERGNMLDVNMANQGFKQGAQGGLMRALGVGAEFKDQEFQFNEADPYFQQEADKRAFQEAAYNQKNASREGWASLVDGIINTGVSIATAPMTGGTSLFGKIFSQKPQRTESTPVSAPTRPMPGFNFMKPKSPFGG